MKRAALMALVVAALALTPALAKDKGWKHGRHGNGAYMGGFAPGAFGNPAFFNGYGGLPPGLAKRGGNLPPGLQKHLMERGQLPPGLQKKLGYGGSYGYPGYGVNPGYYGAPYYGGSNSDAHREFHERQREYERRLREEHRLYHQQYRGYNNGGYYNPGGNSWLPYLYQFWPYR